MLVFLNLKIDSPQTVIFENYTFMMVFCMAHPDTFVPLLTNKNLVL